MKITLMRFERKLEDCWVGVFWRHGYATIDDGNRQLLWTDIWICVIPCFPLHVTVMHESPILFDTEEVQR
jgi:hypothetical protein